MLSEEGKIEWEKPTLGRCEDSEASYCWKKRNLFPTAIICFDSAAYHVFKRLPPHSLQLLISGTSGTLGSGPHVSVFGLPLRCQSQHAELSRTRVCDSPSSSSS